MKECNIYKNYFISETGRIYSQNRGEFNELKTHTSKSTGYVQVHLCKNGKRILKTVHRLVAESFIPNPNNKKTVNHIDGDKTNNDVYNLEWTTYSENHKHAYKNHLMDRRGEKHHLSKLKEKDIFKIRELFKNKFTRREISNRLNFNYQTVSDIIAERRWTHI